MLDTGARPGKELLSLTWAQVRQEFDPTFKKTGEKTDDGEGSIEDEVIFKLNRTITLDIQEHKTKRRLAIGRVPTASALRDIAERNYGKTLEEMLKSGSKDAIFRFREYLNDEQINEGRQARLLPPTSFAKLFESYLKDHNLLIDPSKNKKRMLYSLRHTYATIALTYDKTPIHTLAKQMGTSVAMIEDHYSHMDAVKASHQLRGDESRQLLEAIGEIDKRYLFDDKK